MNLLKSQAVVNRMLFQALFSQPTFKKLNSTTFTKNDLKYNTQASVNEPD